MTAEHSELLHLIYTSKERCAEGVVKIITDSRGSVISIEKTLARDLPRQERRRLQASMAQFLAAHSFFANQVVLALFHSQRAEPFAIVAGELSKRNRTKYSRLRAWITAPAFMLALLQQNDTRVTGTDSAIRGVEVLGTETASTERSR